MEIINFERDKIENIEIEDGSITLYFLNGDTKGKTYPYSALSVSEKLFVTRFVKANPVEPVSIVEPIVAPKIDRRRKRNWTTDREEQIKRLMEEDYRLDIVI